MPSVSNKTEHVCKWKRHTYETGSKIYFCALPKCNKKMKVGLALGKECICWRCGNVFQLNEYSIRLAKPHCMDCHKSKGMSQEEANLRNSDIVRTKEPEFKSSLPVEAKGILDGSFLNKVENLSLADRLKKATQGEDEEEI